MLYEALIKFNDLKPVKWYNFIKQFKNYRLMHRVFKEIKKSDIYNEDKRFYLFKDFILSADALSSLVDPAVANIIIYRNKDMEQFGCSMGTFDATIKTFSHIFNIRVNTKDDTIEVRYETTMVKNITRVFTMKNSNGFIKFDRALNNTDSYALEELLHHIDYYIRTISEVLYGKYTYS